MNIKNLKMVFQDNLEKCAIANMLNSLPEKMEIAACKWVEVWRESERLANVGIEEIERAFRKFREENQERRMPTLYEIGNLALAEVNKNKSGLTMLDAVNMAYNDSWQGIRTYGSGNFTYGMFIAKQKYRNKTFNGRLFHFPTRHGYLVIPDIAFNTASDWLFGLDGTRIDFIGLAENLEKSLQGVSGDDLPDWKEAIDVYKYIVNNLWRGDKNEK